MSVNNLEILGATVYGVPSGNYDGSSLDFVSDAAKAVNYYQGQGSLQVISISVANFLGKITIQGTLDGDTEVATWSECYVYDIQSSPITDYHPIDLVGNFAWVRARVADFQSGTINSVTISY